MDRDLLDMVAHDLAEFENCSHEIARKRGLVGADGDDVRQGAYIEIHSGCAKWPGLAEHIQEMRPVRRLMFIRRCLEFAGWEMYRHEIGCRHPGVSLEEMEFLSAERISPCELEDAERVIQKVKGRLGREAREARFALESVLCQKWPAESVRLYGLDEAEAEKWFTTGLEEVMDVAQQILAEEFGEEALHEFVKRVEIFREYGEESPTGSKGT